MIAVGSVILLATALGPSAAASTEAGLFKDIDEIQMTAGVARLRSCNGLPNTGSTEVIWHYNSTNNKVRVGFIGCLTILRNGATTAQVTAEYRRANNSVISSETVTCSKGLTIDPYHECPLVTTALGLSETAGLDRVVLKIKTTSPAGPQSVLTVISGD